MRTEPRRTQVSRDTLMLYCPYDRKLTEHARREPDGIVCLACGRRVEARGARPPDPASRPIAAQPARPDVVARFRRSQSRRLSRLPVTGIAVGVGVIVLVLVARVAFGGTASSPEVEAPPARPAVAAPAAGAPPADALVKVGNTDNTGAYLRRTTNFEDRLTAWPDGTELRVIGPDVTVGDTIWKHVEAPDGEQGFIPAQYTTPG